MIPLNTFLHLKHNIILQDGRGDPRDDVHDAVKIVAHEVVEGGLRVSVDGWDGLVQGRFALAHARLLGAPVRFVQVLVRHVRWGVRLPRPPAVPSGFVRDHTAFCLNDETKNTVEGQNILNDASTGRLQGPAPAHTVLHLRGGAHLKRRASVTAYDDINTV